MVLYYSITFMSEDGEYVEVLLPSLNNIGRFFTLPEGEKLKIIEVGLSMLDEGKNKALALENSEWEKSMSALKEVHQKDLDGVRRELEHEKQLSVEKMQQFQREKKDLATIIEQNESLKYKTDIQRLEDRIRQSEESLRVRNVEYNALYGELTEKHEEKTDSLRSMYEGKVEENVRIANEMREKYEKTLIKSHNSTIKGQEGEEHTHQQLNCLFPKAEFHDCHKESGRGDFIMTEGEFVMMLEIKNYTGNVNKTEIDKFYRDVKSENNHDIKCAVLLSLRSGIANKQDFTFEIVNNKPVLFLHNVQNRWEYLTIVVNFFKSISNKSIDYGNSELVDTLKKILTTTKRNFNRQRKRIQKFAKDQNDDINDMEQSIQQIFSLLSI